jgi:hypothetical protein
MTFSLSACNWFSKKSNFNIQRNSTITIIDSLQLTDSVVFYENPLPIAGYRIYYLGDRSETIHLEKDGILSFETSENTHREIKDWLVPNSNQMQIFIDTSMVFSSKLTNPIDISDTILTTKFVKSYPIFIYNNSDSTIYIGHFNDLGTTIKQYRSASGNWVNGELPIRYFCGTGARELFLRGCQMLIAKLNRRAGKIEVISRLRYENTNGSYIYSNSFIDYVDSIPERDFIYADVEPLYTKSIGTR